MSKPQSTVNPSLVRNTNATLYDQFFTTPSTAQKCMKVLDYILNVPYESFALAFEPSCGTGVFVNELTDRIRTPEKVSYCDIDARESSHRADFLTDKEIDGFLGHYAKTKGHILMVGNPPFGKNASLAIKFFNRAARHASVIAFILPQTFMKNSVQRHLDPSFFLAKAEALPKNSFLFEGDKYDVNCCFQIWVKSNAFHFITCQMKVEPNSKRDNKELPRNCVHFSQVKDRDMADFAMRRVGGLAGKIYSVKPLPDSLESNAFYKINEGIDHEIVFKNLETLNLLKAECRSHVASNPSIGRGELYHLYNSLVEKQNNQSQQE